ncbi:MAG: histidine kinase [Humibacillus sp.]|nr:histidine kinase [Humibacillus sp.]MDN5779789.1 histidine kinase [Humibacillus sp.]
MTAVTVVIATALVALGLVATATRRLPPRQAVAASLAGIALLLIALDQTALATATDHWVGVAATPVLLGAAGLALLQHWTWAPVIAVGAVAAGPLSTIFADPFHDPTCLSACDVNPLAIWPEPGLAVIVGKAGVALLVGGLVLGCVAGRRWSALPIAVAAAAVAMGGRAEWVTLAAAVTVAAVAADLGRALGRQGRLDAVSEAMAWDGDAETALRSIAPDVRIGYWLEDSGTLVDREGHPVTWDDPGLEVVSPQGPLARLDGLGTAEARAVVGFIRGPARLGVETLRLEAQNAVRARMVSASARRLIARADRERSILEHDLHDGAQQGLVNLGIHLRREPRDIPLPPSVIENAIADLGTVVAEVREIAHGIRPAGIESTGLGHVLRGLANRTLVPLQILDTPSERLAVEQATAVYAAVEDVCLTAVGPVVVSVTNEPEGLRLDIDATDGVTVPERSADRFRALGGRLTDHVTATGTRLTGFLPGGS